MILKLLKEKICIMGLIPLLLPMVSFHTQSWYHGPSHEKRSRIGQILHLTRYWDKTIYNVPNVPALAAKICSPMIKISFVTVLLTFYGIMFMHVQIGLTISAILIQTIIQFQNHLQPCLHLISHYKSKFKIFSNQLNEHICPSGWLLSTFNINFYSFSGSVGWLMQGSGLGAARENDMLQFLLGMYFWKGFCPCNMWSYIACFHTSVRSIWRIWEWHFTRQKKSISKNFWIV